MERTDGDVGDSDRAWDRSHQPSTTHDRPSARRSHWTVTRSEKYLTLKRVWTVSLCVKKGNRSISIKTSVTSMVHTDGRLEAVYHHWRDRRSMLKPALYPIFYGPSNVLVLKALSKAMNSYKELQ